MLVTDTDGQPTPKIIDFGIAKATTSQHLTEMTMLTGHGLMVGTPDYMSPEQADPAEIDIEKPSRCCAKRSRAVAARPEPQRFDRPRSRSLDAAPATRYTSSRDLVKTCPHSSQ